MKSNIIIISIFNSLQIFSQQNFINVPSAEATQKHKLFFQQQINFNEIIQSNSTIDYGLGHGFEIGANILGLNFSERNKSFIINDTSDKDPYNPLVLINGLKQFQISDQFSISTGAQFGLNVIDNKNNPIAGLTYINARLSNVLIKNSSLVIGSYYNSLHFGGTGNRVGTWIGTEIPIVNNFHLMTESVLGTNALCFTSLGLIYYPVNWMPLTFGIQIPNTKNNAYSLVFELTILQLK